MIYENII